MKQHITMEQHREMVDEIIKNGDTPKLARIYVLLGLRENAILSPELFNIGKMIEILKDRLVVIEFLDETEIEFQLFNESADYNFVVQILTEDGYNTINFEKLELCDALWEAVKKMLQGDES